MARALPPVLGEQLEDLDGQTRVSLTQAGYMDLEQYTTALQEGYGKFFDQLERHLAEL